tara:strand:- start:6751 stop:7872 length:1122 start_codon:yes stop_codon:yes gene_type:complete
MRRSILNSCKRIVVKVGSHVVTAQKTGLNVHAIKRIAKNVLEAKELGYEIVIVSSGAIVSGIQKLGLTSRLTSLPLKQAAAAVGQGHLIRAYDHAFETAGQQVAQILLTNDTMTDRERFLNARHTVTALLKLGVIPIVNENDTVSVDEIKFGDNDTLAGMVANLIDAQLLIILSDVDGLFSEDPRHNPMALLIPTVRKVTAEIEKIATGAVSIEGTGGMTSKVETAKRMAVSGIPTIIINGKRTGSMSDVLDGKEIGTVFLPQKVRRANRKHWIAFIRRTKGKLTLDSGAVKAVLQRGKSLLPAGVTAIDGKFDHGDAIGCVDKKGHEIAKGLVNYSSSDLAKIKGRKTGEIKQVLGYKDYDEVIHRDNMVIM